MPNLLHLPEFVWAAISNWTTLITGSFIIALATQWSWLKDKPLPKGIGLGLTVIFLFAGFFKAWDDKNVALLNLQERLKSPRIDLKWGSISSGPQPDGQSLIVVGGALCNVTGPPSGLIDWKMTVQFPNGDEITGVTPPTCEKEFRATIPGSPPHLIVFSTSEYWPRKSQNPIIGGGVLEGWFWAKFANLDLRDAYDKARVIIEFKDVVTGKTHRFTTALGPSGVHMPFLTP